MKLTEMKAAYPELYAQYEKLQAERDTHAAVVTPLREARDKFLAEQVHPLEAKARAMGEEIKAHMPKMAELDRQISGLIAAMGGRG